jgi:hypothetical protein
MKSIITLAIGGSKGSNSAPGAKREPLAVGKRKRQKAS